MTIVADNERCFTILSAYQEAYILTIAEAAARGVALPGGVARDHAARR